MRNYRKLVNPTKSAGAPVPFSVGAGVENTKAWSMSPARPAAFQAEDATLISARLVEGNGKDGIKIMKGNVSFVVPTATVRRFHAELASEEQRRIRWAEAVEEEGVGGGVGGGGGGVAAYDKTVSIAMTPQIWGKKNATAALQAYGGNIENMRAEMQKKTPVMFTGDRSVYVSFYKGVPVLAHLEAWTGLFPRLSVSNIHGSLWPAKHPYPERTVIDVDSVYVQELLSASVPPHLRLSWHPCLGRLGDAAVRDLATCAAAAVVEYQAFKATGKPIKRDNPGTFEKTDHHGFPICMWMSDAYNVDSIMELLGKYEAAYGGGGGSSVGGGGGSGGVGTTTTPTPPRSIIHKVGAFGGLFPDEFVYMAKPKTDGGKEEKKMKLKLNILRMEGLGDVGAGKDDVGAALDPNMHSLACHHIVLNAFEGDLVSSGITSAHNWETFTRAYGPPPAVVWAVPQAVASMDEPHNKSIMAFKGPVRKPFEASGFRAANGIIHARGAQIWFAMGLWLRDNGVPVTQEWAATQIARDRTPIADKVRRHLSQQNHYGIACLTEWMREDDQLALNAGVAGPLRPDIQYRALVVRSKYYRQKTKECEAGNTLVSPLTLKELTDLARLTPAEGTACMRGEPTAPYNLSDKDEYQYYVYALTPEVMSTELNAEQLAMLGGPGRAMAPPPFPAPFGSVFDDDAEMMALADAAEGGGGVVAAGGGASGGVVRDLSAGVVRDLSGGDVVEGGGGCGVLLEDEEMKMTEEAMGGGDEDAPAAAVGERRAREKEEKGGAPAAAKASAKKRGKKE